MKKLAITFIAIILGTGVSFAQSASQEDINSENTVHTLTFDKMSNSSTEEVSRQSITIYMLPDLIIQHLKHSKLGGHTIIGITEVKPEGAAELQYELLLQDETNKTAGKPALLVRFDKFGDILSEKEVPALAQKIR